MNRSIIYHFLEIEIYVQQIIPDLKSLQCKIKRVKLTSTILFHTPSCNTNHSLSSAIYKKYPFTSNYNQYKCDYKSQTNTFMDKNLSSALQEE